MAQIMKSTRPSKTDWMLAELREILNEFSAFADNCFLYLGMGTQPTVFSELRLPLAVDGSQAVGPESIDLTTGLPNYRNCNGTFVQTTCTLVSTTLEYDIEILNHEIISVTPSDPHRVISIANNTFVNQSCSGPQVLAFSSFAAFLAPYVSMNVILGAPPYKGLVSPVAGSSLNAVSAQYVDVRSGYPWALTTHDPSDDIVGQDNELMFRAGVVSSTWPDITLLIDDDLVVNQTVRANQTQTDNVFHSDLRWFAGRHQSKC